VIGRTDWAAEAKRAQQLTGAGTEGETKESSGKGSRVVEVAAAGEDEELGLAIGVVIERPEDQR
jgi:MATE family multidrug resistance protein